MIYKHKIGIFIKKIILLIYLVTVLDIGLQLTLKLDGKSSLLHSLYMCIVNVKPLSLS